MIDPSEIRQQANKWWQPFLQSFINDEPFFPRRIERIGKIKSSQVLSHFNSLQEQVTALYSNSKRELGYGYVVKTAAQNFRRTGTHELPEAIEFETADDFVKYIGKNKEWQTFLGNKKLIEENIAALKPWMLNNVEQLTNVHTNWNDILKVCHYFLAHPRPGLYLRQLPIEVHTKFIEQNEALLRSLLDFLIPGHLRCRDERSLAKRYYLNYDEILVRIRILDNAFAINVLTDLSVRLSDFHCMKIGCCNVLLAENKMNFLLCPHFQYNAIWCGGGFNVSYLRDVEWLKRMNIFYWGDLDIQGFHILHQMRSYFSQTKSIMMDRKTYNAFASLQGTGKRGSIENLNLLTDEERQLFLHLKENNLRLEQEKITQNYADDYLGSIAR